MRFSKRAAPPLDNLADLRAEIDRIDAEMHALLIQRGSIIDRLIAVKGTSASGSAFRPGREASMLIVVMIVYSLERAIEKKENQRSA